MPVFLIPLLEVCGAFLSRLFFSRAGQWLLTALLFLGIQFGSQKLVVEPLLSSIQSSFGGLSAGTVAWMAYLNVDRAITIVLSAFASAAGSRVILKRIGPKS